MNEAQEPRFLFLSQILRRRVKDSEGRIIGRVHDLSALMEGIYPVTHAMVVTPRRRWNPRIAIPWKDVVTTTLTQPADIVIKVPTSALVPPPTPSENEFFLRKELLDNQIVDIRGRKVVRVNDVHLMCNNGEMRVVHVDVGLRGLFRSLGWEKGVDRIVAFFFPRASYLTKEHFVSWKYVQPVSVGSLKRGLLKLSVTMRKLSRLHPADLAEIMQDLDTHQRSALFQSLDPKAAANTLSESTPKMIRFLLETVDSEKAADLLEKMPPDEAADLLAGLPQEEAAELLKKMRPYEAKEVSELLGYEEDTVGGLMTTEFITVSQGTPARELMEKIRGEMAQVETIYYIFVTEENDVLVGVVTLRDLLLSQSDQRIGDFMMENPVSVRLEDSIESLIGLFSKYKVLAIPVTDAEGRMKGIVTIDDILAHVTKRRGHT